mmetsp:Transcript_5937/g.10784  ORF Transcript_5937/g.10784 Transcript_5937/m.10784 type:complete len:223 (-) Transcript_5937:127-795(-)
MRGYNDTLFGEHARGPADKVKFGAPHVVDFGKNMKNSPDGKMYIVGHGASVKTEPQSWMQGSEVYIARVIPTWKHINNRDSWEFFSATDGWTNSLEAATPIVHWANRTGVVTMTYLPAAGRYIMCVSTPSVSPSTVGTFDSYFLESAAITGPFRYVSYLRRFGEQAYFLNIPSKFASSSPDADQAVGAYLSYSANFARSRQLASNPPGGGYWWTLSAIRFVP